MMKILIIILTLILISCEQEIEINDLRVIDLEGNVGQSRTVLLSEVAESIEYIPLETTENSFVGIPRKESIIYENNLLFICQKGDYFKIFNSKGNYIRTFNKRGNGPKEYISSIMVVVDSTAEIISIGSFKNIVEYKTTGDYIKTLDYPIEESLQGVHYKEFGIIDNYYYVLATHIHHKLNNLNYSAIILDSISRVVLKIPYPDKERELVEKTSIQAIDYLHPTPLLFRFKNSVRIKNGYDENIISIDKNLQIDTVYRLNYGKYGIRNFSSNSYSSKVEDKPFLDLHGKIYESSTFLFMRFKTGNLPLKHWVFKNKLGEKVSAPISCSYFNKKTGQFTFIDPCGLDEFGLIDDLEGGPAFWPLYISQDGYMVNHIDAFTFIEYAKAHKVSEKFKKIAAGLKDTDNLVLIRVKLKNE
ncbi:MAG: 6-bladed beta-propeller [Bacteroidia bacterium]|nr:6-bladed beta-propeller [Bacteroidia bacterium]